MLEKINVEFDVSRALVVLEPEKNNFVYIFNYTIFSEFDNCYLEITDYRANGREVNIYLQKDIDWISEYEHKVILDRRVTKIVLKPSESNQNERRTLKVDKVIEDEKLGKLYICEEKYQNIPIIIMEQFVEKVIKG